jgi:hypothetical protein
MNTKALIFSAFCGLGLLGLNTVAVAQTTPGFLSDYQYQVANLSSMEQAQSLIDSETRDTTQNSICANRADIWSFIMNKNTNLQVGKVFIHFTAEGEATESAAWAYHVAPYVLVNGEEMVLDSAFGVFHGQPTPLADWTNYFGKSRNCVVLDPTHNPAHLALEQNNLPNDNVNPNTFTRGAPRQYPATEGICYIRKVPMYYVYPIDVYGADLTLAGQSQYSRYLINQFSTDDALAACKQAMTLGARLSQSCKSYFGLNNH